jgi:hypothetical protein
MEPMKLLIAKTIVLVMLAMPSALVAQTTSQANRAWKPFLASLRAAAKKRDQDALSKLMARDFYYLSSGGDENNNQDTRDEAFEYWASTQVGALEALEKVLAQGAVTNTAMREPGSRRPSRISPPIANNKQAIKARSFDWYAVFEFRDGRWYWVAFTECCD